MTAPITAEFLALQEILAGRYSIERELGRGGMGVVLLARDVALDRLVAIKVLPPEMASVAEIRQRFLSEARTAAGLSHPHIVPIHGVEEHGRFVFFVMGYVDGGPSSCRRWRGRWPTRTSGASSTATSSPTTSCSSGTATAPS